MQLKSGEQFTLSTDPLLVLLHAECETVDDEYEADALSDQRESTLLAPQCKSINFQSE